MTLPTAQYSAIKIIIQVVMTLSITSLHLSGTEITDETWLLNWGTEKSPLEIDQKSIGAFVNVVESILNEVMSSDIISENGSINKKKYMAYKKQIGSEPMSLDSFTQFIANQPLDDLSFDCVRIANLLIEKLTENLEKTHPKIGEHLYLISGGSINKAELEDYTQSKYPKFKSSSIEGVAVAVLLNINGRKGIMVFDPITLQNNILCVMEDNQPPHTGVTNLYSPYINFIDVELIQKGGFVVYNFNTHGAIEDTTVKVCYTERPFISPALTIKNIPYVNNNQLKHMIRYNERGDQIAEVKVNFDGEVSLYHGDGKNRKLCTSFQLKALDCTEKMSVNDPNSPPEIDCKPTEIDNGQCTTCGEIIPDILDAHTTYCRKNHCDSKNGIKDTEDVLWAEGEKPINELLRQLVDLKPILEDLEFIKILEGVNDTLLRNSGATKSKTIQDAIVPEAIVPGTIVPEPNAQEAIVPEVSNQGKTNSFKKFLKHLFGIILVAFTCGHKSL